VAPNLRRIRVSLKFTGDWEQEVYGITGGIKHMIPPLIFVRNLCVSFVTELLYRFYGMLAITTHKKMTLAVT
jgi:hypothetical protein